MEKIMEIELNELTHKDWEDIAADSDYFYVADTGNNYATREDLKIYIAEYLRNAITKGVEIYRQIGKSF